MKLIAKASTVSLVALAAVFGQTNISSAAGCKMNIDGTGDVTASVTGPSPSLGTIGILGTVYGDGDGNTCIGLGTLSQNTPDSSADPVKGFANTAIGESALFSNITGSSNTATGYKSLQNNTEGSYNTASGRSALEVNETGSYNTATG